MAVQTLPYIAHTRESPSVEYRLVGALAGDSITVRFKPSLFCNTIEALSAFVKQGLGVALIPDFVVNEAIKSGHVTKILPNYNVEEKPIYAVHTYSNMAPKSISEAIKAISGEL